MLEGLFEGGGEEGEGGYPRRRSDDSYTSPL